MEVKLSKKPKNVTIIEGFPGFGLVGTIATEFLIDHLKCEQVGKIVLDDAPPIVAIHEQKIVEPLGIFYNKENNILILHAISAATGHEWDIADVIKKLAKDLEAKEIISLEGVGSGTPGEEVKKESKNFYYSNDKQKEKVFEKINVEPLKEGIIIGVTGSLLLKVGDIPVSCVFAETHTNLPDSKAAASIIGVLDNYLGLKIDVKPLLEQAEKFEEKLKGIMSKSQQAEEISEKKKLSYVG